MDRHQQNGAHAAHIAATLDLVKDGDATHVAVSSGSWFDPATWADGRVPGVGARVVIPEGLTVDYDGASEAVVSTIRIDGALRFPSHVDTALSVDTIVVNASGAFEMGSEAEPVSAEAVITFTAINEQPDPGHIGLGLLGLPGARVAIHGEDKTDRAVVSGDQLAGDDVLEIEGGAPGDWKAGDVIVLAGTRYDPNGDNDRNERFFDEVLEITEISEAGVRFVNRDTGETSLRFDHQTPEGFDLDLHVVNLTRSVTFTSAGGLDAPIAERGHIVVMDHDSTVQNVALWGLGRTDKSKALDPMSHEVEINGLTTSVEGSGTNLPGRYPLHVHRAFDHGDDGGAVDFSGNAIWSAPGWGLVLHGSRGHVDGNVVFDAVGAGVVTEDGDEVGYFRNNTVIKVANGHANSDFPAHFATPATKEGLPVDFGFHGNGFWFDTSFSVREASGNVSASTDHAGILIYGHNDGEINRLVDPTHAPEEAHPYAINGVIDPFRVPVGLFQGNDVYNAKHGLFLAGQLRDDSMSGGNTSKTMHKLEHLDRSVFLDTEIWGVRASGIFTSYAQGFEFIGATIVGDPKNPNNGYDARGHDAGILIHKVNHNVVIKDVHVEGFHTGLNVGGGGGQGYDNVDPLDPYVIDGVTLRNNIQNFTPSQGRTGDSPRLNPGMMEEPPFNPYARLIGDFDVDASASAHDPVAMATVRRIGPNAFSLDAAGSYDPDYKQDAQIEGREVIENSIAFYQWDFDRDGRPDAFGRDVTVRFDDLKTREALLTVTDAQGARATTSVTLASGVGVTRNALRDGEFEGGVRDGISDIADARDVFGPAWGATHLNRFGYTMWAVEDGAAQVVGGARPSQVLDQLVINRAEHQGEDLFTFDYQYTNADGLNDDLFVEIWGMNGHPSINAFSLGDPVALYDQEPFTADRLLRTDDILSAGSGEWRTSSHLVDFREGYDYLYTRFIASNVDAKAGDTLRIDNVVLGGTVSGEAVEEAPVGVAGVETVSDGEWVVVSFGTSLEAASVVTGPILSNDGDPATVRVRNVTSTGFEFRIEEWDYQDGLRDAPATVSWMAVEAGRHQLANGVVIEAGSALGGARAADVAFSSSFGAAPSVFGQAVVRDDPAPVATRLFNVDADGFSFRFQEEEAADDVHGVEELSWIAVTNGIHPNFAAASMSAGLNHREATFDLGAAGFAETPAFFAGLQSFRGPDTASVRLAAMHNDQAHLFIEEEQSKNWETWHVREDVAFFATDEGFIFA